MFSSYAAFTISFSLSLIFRCFLSFAAADVDAIIFAAALMLCCCCRFIAAAIIDAAADAVADVDAPLLLRLLISPARC